MGLHGANNASLSSSKEVHHRWIRPEGIFLALFFRIIAQVLARLSHHVLVPRLIEEQLHTNRGWMELSHDRMQGYNHPLESSPELGVKLSRAQLPKRM